MKLFNTRIHGVIDYLMGGLLIISPWLFFFGSGHISTWIPVIAGAVIILYSLFTDYEYGLIADIGTRSHLVLDGIIGIFLAVSPWLFNFNEEVYMPHLIIGIVFIIISVSTSTMPTEARKRKPI